MRSELSKRSVLQTICVIGVCVAACEPTANRARDGLSSSGLGSSSKSSTQTNGSTGGTGATAGGSGSGGGAFTRRADGKCDGACRGTGVFGSPTSYEAGNGNSWMTFGDFNGDGIVDVATANYNAQTVSVIFNDGAGSFANTGSGTGQRMDYAVNGNMTSIDAADVDQDGDLDIMTANRSTSTVTILRNNGSGGFSSGRADVACGSLFWPTARFADFNGDGFPDIVVANTSTDKVSVLMNNGAGAFSGTVGSGREVYSVAAMPYDLAVGDVNGDNKPDVVVAGTGSYVTVLTNSGTGTFPNTGSGTGSRVDYAPPNGNAPWNVKLLDVDGDHDLDIVSAQHYGDDIAVFKNNGSGVFTLAGSYAVGDQAAYTREGDIDGDGDLDLIVGTAETSGLRNVVLFNDGSGAYATSTGYATTESVADSYFVDVNGDNALDIVTNTSGNPGGVVVLLNTL